MSKAAVAVASVPLQFTIGQTKVSKKDLADLLEAYPTDFVSIVIFNTPDPDALASALALSYLLKQHDVKSKIFCQKEISHPNNQAMVNHLDISLHSFKELPSKDKNNYYAIVDFPYQEVPARPDLKCLIHVDHHKEDQGQSAAIYQHVDISVGACATLMVEYLKAFELKDTKQFSKIALGLAYGIYVDTTAFQQATPRDFEALSYLRSFYDPDQLQNLAHAKQSAQTMEVVKKALEHNQLKGTFAYSGIGYISSDFRDSLAIAADFLLTQQGTSCVLVFAIVEDETGDYVNGCFRTNDSAIDVQKFMQSFIVNGTGGGRKTAGGFQEPLGFFAESKNKEKIWDLVRGVVEEKIKPKITLTKAEEATRG